MLETPHTTTAVNQNKPSTGLKVIVSQFSLACVSIAPPMPAIADDDAEDEQLRPPQADADRLGGRLGVPHGREHSAQSSATEVAGEPACQPDHDDLVVPERPVAA